MSTQFEAKVNNQENLYASISNKDGHISICTLYNTTTIPLNAPYARGCQITVDMTGDVFVNTSAYGVTPVFTVVSTGGASGAVNTVFGRTGTVVAQSGDYVKGDVGLGNVDNTSDADKPVSTAQALVNTAKADKTTTISAGIGMSGGGDLSANTSLAMDINGLAEETSIDGAADFIPIYDASNTIIKKVKPNNLPSSGGSGTVTSVSVTTANGVSGTVATSTTTPAISLTLGAITPTSTNGVSAVTMAFNDATSSIQTQLNAKGAGTVTAVSSADANITVATGTTTPVITMVQAPALKSATTTVDVSAATAPTVGQVLTATSGTTATWQTAGGGSAVPIQEEGTTITAAPTAINFVGAGATVTDVAGVATVTIPGGGSSGVRMSAQANSTGTVLPDSTDTTIIGWTESIDTGSNFNPTTGEFTVPTTGNYYVSAYIALVSSSWVSGDFIQIDILKNGSSIHREMTFTSGTISNVRLSVQGSILTAATASDIIKISAYQETGTTRTTSTSFGLIPKLAIMQM